MNVSWITCTTDQTFIIFSKTLSIVPDGFLRQWNGGRTVHHRRPPHRHRPFAFPWLWSKMSNNIFEFVNQHHIISGSYYEEKNSKQTISIYIFIYFFTLWNLFAAVAQKGLKPTVDEGKTVLPSKKQKTGNKCRTFSMLPNSFCLHCFQLLKVVKKYPRQGSTIEIPLWFGQILL